MLDPADLAEILQLLDSLEVDEMHLRTSRLELTLIRSPGGGWTRSEETTLDPEPVAVADSTSAAAPAAAHLHLVTAPLPGTFYRAPSPGAAPFVEVGDTVSASDVVCIVETMKLMNTVAAGVSGEIVEICVDNGNMVEQGAVLVHVEPNPDGA